MTIGTNDQRKEYPGNGVTDTFDGPRSFTAGEVVVYLVDDATNVGVLQSAYTLSGVGGTNTVIVMDTPPGAGYTLLVLHVPVFGQSTDITNLGRFLPEVIENALDKLAQQSNYLKDQSDRSLKMPTYVQLSSYELPVPTAGYYLRWNSAGDALENAIVVDIVGISVSVYMESFLGSSNQAAARTSLGFGTMAMQNIAAVQSFEMDYGQNVAFTPDTSTDVGVDIPTSLLFNFYSVGGTNHNHIYGIDASFNQYWCGSQLNFYYKDGATWTLAGYLIPGLVYGTALLAIAGNITKMIDGSTYDVGLLDCPLTTKNSAYTFTILDRGRAVKKTNATAYAWTVVDVATGANFNFPEGSIIPLVNIGSAGTVTITPGAGVTLKLAGSALTGARTLPINAQGYLYLVDKATNTWIVGGAGVG